MAVLHIVLFAALFATSLGELAKFKTCDGVTEDVCKVTEVRVTPCKNENECLFRRRKNATISFDFTPNFATDKLETAVYWDNGMDVRFNDFGSSDGCLYTTCPTEPNKSQTLSYSLYINKRINKGIYALKWKVWNQNEESQKCCFGISIRIQ